MTQTTRTPYAAPRNQRGARNRRPARRRSGRKRGRGSTVLWGLSALAFCALLCLVLTGCADAPDAVGTDTEALVRALPPMGEELSDSADTVENPTVGDTAAETVYHVGLCVSGTHAAMDQIVENLRARLDEIGKERGAAFTISRGETEEASGTARRNREELSLSRTAERLVWEKPDLLIGVGTPAASALREASGGQIPVLFAAASDPVGTGLAETIDAPGGFCTGTSDRLDTAALLSLMLAADPDVQAVGLLYDQNQPGIAVAEAVDWMRDHGIGMVERIGSTPDEIFIAAQALAEDGVDAVFSPTDNTVMEAAASVCAVFAEAGIPYYAGADAFARSGAFVGYGADYAQLGRASADMAAEILLDGANPSTLPVRVADDRIAAVNTDTCSALGRDFEAVRSALEPLCARVDGVSTAAR